MLIIKKFQKYWKIIEMQQILTPKMKKILMSTIMLFFFLVVVLDFNMLMV